MPLLRSRRRRTIHVAVVRGQIERADGGVLAISAMHGLAVVADDDVLHDTPDDVVENRDADQRDVAPRHENGAQDHERDAGGAVEVFLKIKLAVTARHATLDQRIGRRSDDGRFSAAVFAWPRRLPRFAGQPRIALRTEKVHTSHAFTIVY